MPKNTINYINPLILTFLIISFYSQGDNNDIIPPSVKNSIQFEQKQRLEFESAQRDELENKRAITLSDNEIEKSHNKTCFTIDKIIIKGVAVFSTRIQQQLILPYQGYCLSMTQILNIAKEITNYYIKQGYITSHAFIPEQDLAQHKLIISVIEGCIESIDIENSPQRLTKMIYPNKIGQVLNLRDIEQGLEQLNRSTSAKYTIDIQPGSASGYSRILINKQSSKFPFSSQLNLDNSGTKSTGKTQFTGTLSADSLLGLGEQWSLSVNTDTDMSHSHHSRYYTASLNIPYGYWSYRYQFYRNNTLQSVKTSGSHYNYQGKNSNQQFDISRLIYRDSKQRLILQASLKHKKAQTLLAQQILTINSPTLTSLYFNPQYSTLLGQGYFTVNPAIELGISALGASPDYIATDSPRSHYRKYSLSSSYQYYFAHDFIYLTSFYGQYTPDNLYGIERISIGGQYSVRGYQEQSLSGNRGFYWRNEINSALANSDMGQLRFIAALDFGYLAADRYQVDKASLFGAATGLSFSGNSIFSTQLLMSKPLYSPAYLKPDNWSMYWSVSLEI